MARYQRLGHLVSAASFACLAANLSLLRSVWVPQRSSNPPVASPRSHCSEAPELAAADERSASDVGSPCEDERRVDTSCRGLVGPHCAQCIALRRAHAFSSAHVSACKVSDESMPTGSSGQDSRQRRSGLPQRRPASRHAVPYALRPGHLRRSSCEMHTSCVPLPASATVRSPPRRA